MVMNILCKNVLQAFKNIDDSINPWSTTKPLGIMIWIILFIHIMELFWTVMVIYFNIGNNLAQRGWSQNVNLLNWMDLFAALSMIISPSICICKLVYAQTGKFMTDEGFYNVLQQRWNCLLRRYSWAKWFSVRVHVCFERYVCCSVMSRSQQLIWIK